MSTPLASISALDSLTMKITFGPYHYLDFEKNAIGDIVTRTTNYYGIILSFELSHNTLVFKYHGEIILTFNYQDRFTFANANECVKPVQEWINNNIPKRMINLGLYGYYISKTELTNIKITAFVVCKDSQGEDLPPRTLNYNIEFKIGLKLALLHKLMSTTSTADLSSIPSIMDGRNQHNTMDDNGMEALIVHSTALALSNDLYLPDGLIKLIG